MAQLHSTDSVINVHFEQTLIEYTQYEILPKRYSARQLSIDLL
jgi:hypothetical protein